MSCQAPKVSSVMRIAAGLAVGFTGAAAGADDPVTGDRPDGVVKRAVLTTASMDREPIDELVTVGPGIMKSVSSELKNLAGRTVTHRWAHAGMIVSEISFEVGGPAGAFSPETRCTWIDREHGPWQAWMSQAGPCMR